MMFSLKKTKGKIKNSIVSWTLYHQDFFGTLSLNHPA